MKKCNEHCWRYCNRVIESDVRCIHCGAILLDNGKVYVKYEKVQNKTKTKTL